MWITLTMVVLFVGFCWFGSAGPSRPERANINEAPDQQTGEFDDLMELLDEASKVDTSLTRHQMGFMTPDHIS